MNAAPFTYLNESTGLFELIGNENGSYDDKISNEKEHVAKKIFGNLGRNMGVTRQEE